MVRSATGGSLSMLLVSLLLCMCLWPFAAHAARGSTRSNKSLQDLDYRVFPRRTQAEAAVLEWGHSAIISALDASVALFGPQTAQAALLEVECMPVLASPINGVPKGYKKNDDVDEEDQQIPIKALDNADEVHGNMVVMTNNGGLSGLAMAKIAKLSGAAALLVVNVDEERPDDIHRLALEEGEGAAEAGEIDIPVAMISLNSANVLTTATVTAEMKAEEIINNGMPDRVRLYAGGDRPFFEDVEHIDPTLYLIHNMLTEAEADDLVKRSQSKMSLVDHDDILQLTYQSSNYHKVKRAKVWQGMILGPAKKAIEERIEQVTGFPSTHYSDFVVDKLETGSYWKPHYDTHPYLISMATITVFLTGVDDIADIGGSIVYPSASKPIRIAPVKGLAVVHHNTDPKHELDLTTVHALLPPNEPIFVARKYVFTEPVPISRRRTLPAIALLFGGKLPRFVVQAHDALVEKYGLEQGTAYFEKACIFVPVLLLLLIAQAIGTFVHSQMSKGTTTVVATATTASTTAKKQKSRSKKPKVNKSE